MFKNKYILLLLMTTLIFACEENQIYKETKKIENGIWQIDFKPEYSFEIKDTTKFYDIFLQAQSTENFKTQNLWIFYQIDAPNNKSQNDTIEYMLFDDKGKPIGKQNSKTPVFNLVYKSKIKFPAKGLYKLSVTQGMRKQQEPGISELTLLVKEIK